MVFCWFLPIESNKNHNDLHWSFWEKLQLNDASLQFWTGNFSKPRFWFPLWFLGTSSYGRYPRALEREFNIDLIVTWRRLLFLQRSIWQMEKHWMSPTPEVSRSKPKIASIERTVCKAQIMVPQRVLSGLSWNWPRTRGDFVTMDYIEKIGLMSSIKFSRQKLPLIW